MAHETIRNSLATTLALGAMLACNNGASNAPPPQTPAAQTTTTGATTNDQGNQPTMPTQPNAGTPGTPSTGDTSGQGNTPDNNANMPPPNAGTGPGMTGATGSTSGMASGTSNPSSPATDTMALDDAQIVAVIQAADTGEIAQAREVLKKSKNARVRQFAQHMITAHSAAESKIANIDGKIGLTPQTNAVAEQLTSGSEQVMGNLRSASGSDFDKTYVDAQVTQHTKVLDLLDNKLIPHAQNSDLVKALQEIRAKVAGHLNDAQALQTSLGQSQ